jgi:ABC-type hemin transport system ATPase subunit
MENVTLPLALNGSDGKENRALEMLKRVGLEKRAHHKPSELSGGEQQLMPLPVSALKIVPQLSQTRLFPFKVKLVPRHGTQKLARTWIALFRV